MIEAADVEIVGDGMDSDQAILAHIRTQVFFDDRPAPGTRCAVCDLKGNAVPPHYCPAKAYLGEYAVCGECSKGEVCGYAAALDRMHSGAAYYGEFEAAEGLGDPGHRVELEDVRVASEPAAPQHPWAAVKASLNVENLRTTGSKGLRGRIATRRVVLSPEVKPEKLCEGGCLKSMRGKAGTCGTCWERIRRERAEARTAAKAAKRVQPVEKLEREEEPMGRGGVVTRISDDVRAMVRAEYGTMATLALARKYEISGGAVSYICRDLKAAKKSGHPPATKPVLVKSAGKAIAATPAARASVGELVTLQVPETGLDRMFASLDLASKARAIQFLIREGVGI